MGLDWTQTYWVLTGTIQMQCIEAWNSVGDDKEQLCCNWYCIYSACIRLGWWGVTRSSINYWRGVAVLTTLLHLGGEGEWKEETIQLNHKQQPRSESFLSYIKGNLYIKWNLSVEGTSSFELWFQRSSAPREDNRFRQNRGEESVSFPLGNRATFGHKTENGESHS